MVTIIKRRAAANQIESMQVVGDVNVRISTNCVLTIVSMHNKSVSGCYVVALVKYMTCSVYIHEVLSVTTVT